MRMISPWKSWCRLCANPNGGVTLLNPDGVDRLLSEKIKKYLSISVLKEDKVSCILCSKCQEQLAAFDNFVHHCLQVQSMFGALCELVDDNVPDEQVIEIRKQFLHTDFEPFRGNAVNGNTGTNHIRKRASEGGKENSPSKIRKENGNERKQLSPTTKRKLCEERSALVTENNTLDCRKNGPLKEIAELKQAFTEENGILGDSLDSDFNEESFGHLLDSDDAFQPALRNAGNGFKVKDDDKSMPNTEQKQPQLVESSRLNGMDKNSSDHKVQETTQLMKRHDGLKLRDCNNDLSYSVLSSDVNGTCTNSFSDTDINDFICDEDGYDDIDDDDGEENFDKGNSNGGEEMRMNGTWKELDRSKCEVTSREQHKLYELNEMFVEPGSEGGCPEGTGWSVQKAPEEKVKAKKKVRIRKPPTLKCDQCEKTFYRKATLDAHLISHKPKDEQPYVCCKCARRFHLESLLRNHERIHLPNEEKLLYPCDLCNKKLSSRSAVTAHVKAVHFGERPFVCHLCGHTFSSKGVLQEHLTIHSDEEPWHCTQCSKRFKTKYRLKIHMDTHRDTPYTCPHCSVKLSTRRTLRMHLVVHRDTKAYQCATCGKAFRRAKDLKNHQNLHTGRKPYTCPFCSRTFANGSNCRSHKRRMHPEELRQYEASLSGNNSNDLINSSEPLDTDTPTNLIGRQNHDEDENQSNKEDSQDSLLTEMALDLQQPQMLSHKSVLSAVDDDPVATAADLTLAPLVTLTSTLPKLEPDDSRFVMNLTTQMHETHDSMDAMSPLNLNIMSPMNLNISSPLNLNMSSPLNLNISSVLHSPTGRNQQPHSMQTQHHQTPSRYQQQPQHLSMQPTQPMQHHQTLAAQPQLQQIHHQQVPRSSMQITTLQASGPVHSLSSQTQLPAHLNNTVHHTPQIQPYIPLNSQGSLYGHHTSQETVSSAAVAHSMSVSSSTTLPSFSNNVYVQHSMSYGRGSNM